jgi:hypothetical protein
LKSNSLAQMLNQGSIARKSPLGDLGAIPEQRNIDDGILREQKIVFHQMAGWCDQGS